MRLRTQLIAAIAITLSLGGLSALLIVRAEQHESSASEIQARAHSASHEVSGLLVLTQEYARHSEARAAQQWQQRHTTIVGLLPSQDSGAAVKELRSVTQALPQLFTRLEELPPDDDAFTLERKEVLIDQLLTNTQAMSDLADQWYQEAADERRAADQWSHTMALVSPLTMLALLLAGAAMVRLRVLRPLDSLTVATSAISRGDRTVRVAIDSRDEFGDLSRRFDDMTIALARSDEQLRHSEQRLRAVTDSLPVLIAYADRDEVHHFANAHFKTVFGREPETFLGQTLVQMVGPAHYAEVKPHVEAVLRGERQSFEMHVPERDGHLLVDYLPDVGADGEVTGFYVLVIDITARKHAELAQARSERLLRLMSDNLPALSAYIDLEERYRFANAYFERAFGLDPQAMLGRTVEEVYGAANYEPIREHLAGALAGQRQHFERIARGGDGREIHLLTDYIPDRDERGQVVGLFAMAIDVSELKQAELRQVQSEQRVRSILKHAPDAFVSIDAQSRIREWNRQAELTFGWSKDEVEGRQLADMLIPEAFRDAHNAGMKRFAVTGVGPVVNQRIEITALHKDGHAIPIELSVAAVNEGTGYAATAFLRDISQRKMAEGLLRDSEQRLRQITDNLPVLISYIDREGCLRFANETFRTWLGIDPASVIGKHGRDVVGDALYEHGRVYIERALAGERVEFENESTAEGITRTTQVTYIPDVDADGSVRGTYALSIDVTALKAVERKLQSLARFDTLTGLANRLQLNEKLPEVLARAQRTAAAVGLMYLDIDRFKSINDQLGHAAGDLVLQEFAKRLVASVRATDTVVRLAGDEFVIIIEGLHHRREAQAIAEMIINQMKVPMRVVDRDLIVSTSVGVAFHDPADPITTPELLLAKADAALYEAKEAGRSTYHLVSHTAPAETQL